MKLLVWLVAFGIVVGLGYWLWRVRKRWAERKQASEERFASFMAQTMKASPPKLDPAPASPPAAAVKAAAPAELGTQRLLFEAAAKAGEAGEPVLSIQLYSRLIARYPNGAFEAQARAAVEAQKSKIARP